MSLEIKINKKCLDEQLSEDGTIKLEGEAFFFFPAKDGYKPCYTIFTSQDYDGALVWERDPFPEEALQMPHKMRIGNNDELTFVCQDANITYFRMESYKAWKDWFLRPEAKTPCSIHYHNGSFERGNSDMLKECGVEINDSGK
ncbi:hypothetical protein GOV03_04730 [Candidatus Woesearchaeota archaeon]|nr:hypothetical protein [Candidatus Woesearchaeota archaeon]